MSEDFNMPLCRIKKAKQQFDRGRFARSIGTKQTEDFPTVHVKVNAVYGSRLRPAPEIVEKLGETADGNDNFAVRARRLFQFGIGLADRHKLETQNMQSWSVTLDG